MPQKGATSITVSHETYARLKRLADEERRSCHQQLIVILDMLQRSKKKDLTPV